MYLQLKIIIITNKIEIAQSAKRKKINIYLTTNSKILSTHK